MIRSDVGSWNDKIPGSDRTGEGGKPQAVSAEAGSTQACAPAKVRVPESSRSRLQVSEATCGVSLSVDPHICRDVYTAQDVLTRWNGADL